ncbi:MAG: hypothetical protein E7590_03680 [Ruminococcaceae bacterium]|nr:hypothetical protein [Oscillospiraceae bacterium]
MKKFCFYHPYHPMTWQAMIDQGLVREGDGVKFNQSLLIGGELKFNNLAAKDGELYRYLERTGAPLYIDRLQGGSYIEEYPYDMELIDEYRTLLGDRFMGWQMHEWLSNYRSDLKKLEGLPADKWQDAAAVKQHIFKKYPYPCLFLESMSAEEMAAHGKPADVTQFRENMFDIYRKRLRTHGELIPCDSIFLAYEFEFKNGARVVMPEVGAQSADARMQICYARGEAKAYGRDFGVYYEPWGGKPFSACCYQRDGKNEWGIGENRDFPFETKGANGGSSRSLQWRIFLYGYLNNAAMMAEEWGLCNTFVDWESFALSDYGKVKLDFLNFTRKYADVGEKLTPAVVILPEELDVLDDIREPRLHCSRKLPDEVTAIKLEGIKDGIKRVFAAPTEVLGTECKTLINSEMPDAVDMLNAGAEKAAVIDSYRYLINLTGDADFAAAHPNCVCIEQLESLLREALPCTVEGLHWLVNERIGGGYYLTVFNNIGIERTVEKGEIALPEGKRSAKVTFKNGALPTLLESDGTLETSGDAYILTLPAGGYAFIRF